MSPAASDNALREAVARRAAYQCEYCRLPERWTSLPFQLDHVIAEKHEGETTLENLAYSCLHCNSFKGPNIAGRDKETDETVRLFDPRRDRWDDHFFNGVGRCFAGELQSAVLLFRSLGSTFLTA